MNLRRAASVLLASTLTLGATLAMGAAPAVGASSKPRVVTIGVIAPLDAGLTSFGRGIRNSVELAVAQANAADLVPGWTIKVRALDDSSDPLKGAKAAKKLAADPTVVAVVGPYNSGVAEQAAPVLAKSGIALISPSNTLTSLTQGPDPAAPKRPLATYFRMVGPDSLQADFLAARARALGFGTAAVVSETKAVSKGLADRFAVAFSAAGGTNVVQSTVPDGATAAQFADFIASAMQAQPGVVFFGGEYEVAATLRSAATKAGLVAPMMGGDGMNDPAYISKAGAAAAGTYASGTGVPMDTLANGDEFLAAYNKAGYKDAPTNYGPYSYDATNAVLNALPAILGTAKSIPSTARAAVVAAVQATDVEGLTGRVAFDTYGDALDPQFTLYQVSGTPAAWVALPPA
ncbi:MAG TPA: branched-chain amino acid ABC transporter substrate-binding protein [Acidimicrobiia bacterium]|nr:branched-chain amino acid ABC transporter substrate-binding protein [Acidimicrobiia bacterium]